MTDTEKFLRQFNEHWVRPDVDAILADVTDDIRFVMAGKAPVEGRTAFRQMLDEIPECPGGMDLRIDDVIIDGDRAALTGIIGMSDGAGGRKAYAFCDIYRLSSGKVAELSAYVLEVDKV